MRARPFLTIGAIALCGWSAHYGYRVFERRHTAPFRMWDSRAGQSFQSLDDQALRESKERFTCVPFVGSSQLCELPVSGLKGRMQTLVDSAGTSILVQYFSTDSTSVYRDEARKMAAEWSLVRKGEPGLFYAARGEKSATRWVSEDGRWAASMRFSHELETGPSVITVTDVEALAAVKASSPDALFRLAAHLAIDPPTPEELAAVWRSRFVEAAATVVARSAAGRALSVAARSAPICEPSPSATDGQGYGEQQDQTVPRVIQEALAASYPGSRLVVGERTLMATGSSRGESVTLLPLAVSEDAQTLVIPVQLVDRAMTAERQVEAFVSTCRAPTELVVATLDSTPSVREARRLVLDEEATYARVMEMRFDAAPSGARPRLRVQYRAAYGSERWSGAVSWDAVVDVDSMLVVSRLPSAVVKKEVFGTETSSLLEVDGMSAAGAEIMVAPASADSLPRFLVVPFGTRRLPSGWMLLDLF